MNSKSFALLALASLASACKKNNTQPVIEQEQIVVENPATFISSRT